MPLPSKLLRKCLYEAPDVLRDRLVLVRRAHFRQYIGVCEHVEAERSGERSALNAEPADVLCGRLLNAEPEEVPSGEGLKVFDFLHDVQTTKKPPARAEGFLVEVVTGFRQRLLILFVDCVNNGSECRADDTDCCPFVTSCSKVDTT